MALMWRSQSRAIKPRLRLIDFFAGLAAEHFRELRRPRPPRRKEALHPVAAARGHEVDVLAPLDAFGHDFKVERTQPAPGSSR